MNRRAVAAIARKDIRAVLSSAQLWAPMVIVPMIFIVALPLMILLLSGHMTSLFPMGGDTAAFIGKLVDGLPVRVREAVLSFDTLNQQMAYLFLGYLFTPLFLLLPAMTSSIISGNSFAGEKERRTLESLLLSPVSERDLLAGKMLAAFIPAMAVTLSGAIIYGVIVDAVGYGLFGRLIFPTVNWILTLFWLAPALSLLCIFLNVAVSAKVRGYQEAQQFSVMIILPLLALFAGQMTGVLFLGTLFTVVFGLALLLIATVLIVASSRLFSRQTLFMSQM